jgi:hypothetical protein
VDTGHDSGRDRLWKTGQPGCPHADMYRQRGVKLASINREFLPEGGQTAVVPERKGWDSNPRVSCPTAGFQDRCLKPLGHPSIIVKSRFFLTRHRTFWQLRTHLPCAVGFRHGARCERSRREGSRYFSVTLQLGGRKRGRVPSYNRRSRGLHQGYTARQTARVSDMPLLE